MDNASLPNRSEYLQYDPIPQLDLYGLRVLDGGMATELERKGLHLDGLL